MNYWLDTHLYQQSNKTSPPNATGWRALGVGDHRIYVDHGLTGTNRDRARLRLALAAGRAGDRLVVTKLDRLARSLPDARDILDELTKRNVKLSLGGSIHDPTDTVGRLLFNVLAMVAEVEADLVRLRTREGMKVAKAKGRLRGKQPKLKPTRPNICLNCTTSAHIPKPNSPNSSASDDPRSTAPLTGCGHATRAGAAIRTSQAFEGANQRPTGRPRPRAAHRLRRANTPGSPLDNVFTCGRFGGAAGGSAVDRRACSEGLCPDLMTNIAASSRKAAAFWQSTASRKLSSGLMAARYRTCQKTRSECQ